MYKKPFLFSASMLQDYQDCQRRFELKYVLKQTWPSIPMAPIQEYELHMLRGRQFHFLIHQYFAGIPPAKIKSAVNDDTLLKWFNLFLSHFNKFPFKDIHSEIRLSANLGNHTIVAIYDLVAQLKSGQIEIYDWKTSLHKPNPDIYHSKMQSSIYPYVLMENLKFLFPNVDTNQFQKISMIYWFPEFPNAAVCMDYEDVNHTENSELLTALLDQIEEKITGSQFPMTLDKNLCKFCQFRSLCNRGVHAGSYQKKEMDHIDCEIFIDFDALPPIDADI